MSGSLTIRQTAEGASFSVRVQPRARKNEVCGVQGNALKVRLTAPPVEGAANEALVAFLAKSLGVRKSQVEILQGRTSRAKVVAVSGMSPDKLRERLL